MIRAKLSKLSNVTVLVQDACRATNSLYQRILQLQKQCRYYYVSINAECTQEKNFNSSSMMVSQRTVAGCILSTRCKANLRSNNSAPYRWLANVQPVQNALEVIV